jgi:hypothetical protein
MKLYFYTQAFEFGRPKFGDDYIIDITPEDSVEAIIQKMEYYLNVETDEFREYISGYAVVEDDFKTQSELDQLEYEGRISYHPRKLVFENGKAFIYKTYTADNGTNYFSKYEILGSDKMKAVYYDQTEIKD